MIPKTFLAEPEPYIGYIRVSTWREEAISPELQRTAIQQWAARTGRRIIDWVIDLDMTGRNFRRRIMGAIERVERREAAGIAVWKYSRFGRNDTGIAVNLARLEEAGGQLESATEQIDARTAVGKFNRRVLFDLAVFESDRASEQWRETHEYRRKAGLPAQGRRKFGYVWHPRRVPDATSPTGYTLQQERYLVEDEQGPVLTEMYERQIAGKGAHTIAHWLNEEIGVTTTWGNLWSVDGVLTTLDSGFGAGLIRVHDPECRCPYAAGKTRRCPVGSWQYLPGAHDAVIDPEQWEAFRAHRRRMAETAPRARRATYTLTGLARHATCRHALVASAIGKGDRGSLLVCNGHKRKGDKACSTGATFKREQVEAAVLEWVRKVASPLIGAMAPTAPTTAPGADARAQRLRRRARLQSDRDKASNALDNLVAAYAMDPTRFPMDAYDRTRDKFSAEIAQADAQLRALDEAEEETPPREQFERRARELAEVWELLEPEERSGILRQMVRRVACYDLRVPGRRSVGLRVEVHPVWDPDPWAEAEA